LIPELIGYLAQQTEIDAANVSQWMARHLASEHTQWNMAQAISVLADVERLCPHLVKPRQMVCYNLLIYYGDECPET
jgi:DNA mismatch repair protein MutL